MNELIEVFLVLLLSMGIIECSLRIVNVLLEKKNE